MTRNRRESSSLVSSKLCLYRSLSSSLSCSRHVDTSTFVHELLVKTTQYTHSRVSINSSWPFSTYILVLVLQNSIPKRPHQILFALLTAFDFELFEAAALNVDVVVADLAQDMVAA